MSLVRRILLLVAVSVGGVALLAPLAARSATPVPIVVDRLLADVPAPVPAAELADRGGLTARDAAGTMPAESGVESLGIASPPTPGAAPMEATLHSAATPVPVAAAPARVVTYDGSTVWDDLAQCESGGNWAINTGNGYYGGLQFSYDTWHGYGGGEFAAYPHEATREEQIIVAERLHAARGFAPWPACRDKLGLP